MALTQTQVSQLYVTLFGRASEGAGNEYWQATADDLADGATEMLNTQAAEDYFGDSMNSNQAFIEHIYFNTLGKTYDEDPGGIDYWVNLLDEGVSRGEVTASLIDAVYQYADSTDPVTKAAYDQFVNRVAVSDYCADTIQAPDLDASDPAAMAPFQEYIAFVTDDPATVTEAQEQIFSDANPAEDFTFTQQADNIVGQDGVDNVFMAPVTQNETGSGALANTFDTGDVLDGGLDSRNVLDATLIASGTIGGQNPAIAATTTNVQEVYLQAQNVQGPNDAASNTTFVATVDAGMMDGVEQWWTDNSRADIRIEDIRSLAQETTFGMRLTDPAVGYQAYFNPVFMEGDLNTDSALTVRIQEITDGQDPDVTELANISVIELNFDLDGVSYSLSNEAMAAADTWAELEAGIAEALAGDPDLASLTVSFTGNGIFVIEDPDGGVFTIDETTALIFGAAPDIDVRNRVDVGQIIEESLISTTLLLDGVGSGSRGGAVNIAAMSGDRGVELMNVLVDRDSAITSLSSVNSPNTNGGRSFDSQDQLQEVYLTHLEGGNEGDFEIGLRTILPSGVSTTTDDRMQTQGLTDVRVFDASGFTGALKVGAQLTQAVFNNYLLGVLEPVQFSYLLGDGGSNLNLLVDNTVAGDPDFQLEIVGGTGDDRINLSGLAVKQQTTIDGGTAEGTDTLEINTSSGWAATQNGADIVVANPATDLTAAETSFESVTNIDNLIIAGALNTTHDLVAAGLGDIPEITIASSAAANTRLVNFDADSQEVTVSGQNQTLGAGNNGPVNFGTIRLSDTTGDELGILLDNTARVDGTMTVAALTIDNTVGNASEVRTLNLESGGVRDTSNIIITLNGNLVNTFNLDGSQDLSIINLASAANNTAASASSRDSLVVDGSGLGIFDEEDADVLVDQADLYLGVSGGVITAVDAALGTDRTVELIGTEGDADILNIRDGVTTTNATTISGFETIRFGDLNIINGANNFSEIVAATNFNATNVTDVTLYDLVDSDPVGAISLTNLRSTENVQINAATLNAADTLVQTSIEADVTLAATNPTTGSHVSIDFVSDATTALFAGTFWQEIANQPGNANLNIQDFGTVSLDMGGTVGAIYDYGFNLNLLANPTSGRVNARTLEITGGHYDIDPATNGFINIDSLTLNQLDTALTTVDFSDYAGDFNTAGWNSTLGTNASVIVNEFGFNFDIGGDNTIFGVPAGTAAGVNTAEIQTLDFTGFGNLADGESITLTFAGGEYIYTNTTGAEILDADIDNAIIADATANPAHVPSAFEIAADAGGTLVQLTASSFGDMPNTVVAASDPADAPGAVAVNTTTAGDLNATNVTGYDLVTAASEFLTKFVFTDDVYDYGVVWQIDDFQAIDAGDNITISNQTQLDLRALGVDSATDITIQTGEAWNLSLSAADIADLIAYGNGDLITGGVNALDAGDTVITSNEGLNYTIVLTGVLSGDLQNENIVGIA